MIELSIENEEENVTYMELVAAMAGWLDEKIDTYNHFKDDKEAYGDWLIEITKDWMSGRFEDLDDLQFNIDMEFDEDI